MEKYQELVNEYRITIETTSGCGLRGQYYIDNAYTKLEKYVRKHPELTIALPRKHRCADDGVGGMSGAFSQMSRRFC